jgi:SAM-dependent methyltransferase
MTTLPSEDPRALPSDLRGPLHEQRKVAESFGSDAGRYDRARPSYPAALVDRIVAASPGTGTPRILDVGCGTGISGRLFQAAGCQVLGVDPDARMAELARDGGLDVEVAKFEEWDAGGRSFDAVIAAQAWHWVDPVAGAAKAAAVLRPGGRLAVFWNALQPPADLRAAFGEVYQRVLPDSPVGGFWSRPAVDAYLVGCGKTADAMRQAGGFGEPQTWRFDWSRPYTRDEWLDVVPTFGGHSLLPPTVQAELLAGIGAAVDAAGGAFTMDYAPVNPIRPRQARSAPRALGGSAGKR